MAKRVFGLAHRVAGLGMATLVLAAVAMPSASASPQELETPVFELTVTAEGLVGPSPVLHTANGVTLASLEADPLELLEEFEQEFDFYYESPQPVPLTDDQFGEELEPSDAEGFASPQEEQNERAERYRPRDSGGDFSLLGDLVAAPQPGSISMMMVVFAVLVVLWNAKQESR